MYEIRGSSTSPAPNATLTDIAPRGVRFTRIIDHPGPGVCSISRAGRRLTCTGSLVGGQSYGMKVRVSVTASAGTTIRNTAFAACRPVPAVPCVAKDSATTRLIGLFLPPSGCANVSVSPRALLRERAAADARGQGTGRRQCCRRRHRRRRRSVCAHNCEYRLRRCSPDRCRARPCRACSWSACAASEPAASSAWAWSRARCCPPSPADQRLPMS